jgi:hypothetical protein
MPPLAQSLWVLAVVKDNTPVKVINPKTISFILSELKEIDLNEKAIVRAFARAGKKVKPYMLNREPHYEIMSEGRRLVQNTCTSPGNNVLFFTGKKSWSDPNKNFPRIIKMLKGNLCIVDPFYGNGTFYVLDKFGRDRRIRFLTCELGAEEQANMTKFDINLKRFRREFKNIEMRKYGKRYELHDRYIIADNAIVIVGHGIKDLADKESFVIFLPRELVVNFLPVLKKTFEERWKKSNNI